MEPTNRLPTPVQAPPPPLPLAKNKRKEPRYWATCVVEGVFLPDEGVLVSSDGHAYKAHQASSHKRWTGRNPEDALECRLHTAWPRTNDGQVELTLVNSYKPFDQECEHLEPLVNTCSIAGDVTNQKTKKGVFVMRIKRNTPAPKGAHRQAEFSNHLLFVRGLLQPLSLYQNHIVRIDCRLEKGQLVLASVASIGESLEEVLELGGLRWPWPFQRNVASLKRLSELNPDTASKLWPGPDCRDVLLEQLLRLDNGAKGMAKEAGSDRRLARDADRLRKIADRIRTTCKAMQDDDLRGMLKRTRLLSVLDSLQPDLTAASKMTPAAVAEPKPAKAKARATAAPAFEVPENLRPVADLLLRKYFDDLIGLELDLTPIRVRQAVQQLVACGWYDALSPEQQARLNSYQLKKVLKLRAAA